MLARRCPGAVVGLGAVIAVAAIAIANGQWDYLGVAAVTAVAGGVGALDLYRVSGRNPVAAAPAAPARTPPSRVTAPADDLIAIIGPDGTLQQVSGSMGEALALPTDRLFGLDVMRLVHPEDRGQLVGMVIEAEQAGESESVSLRFVRGDKTWAPFEVRALALPDAGAGESGAIMIGRKASPRPKDLRPVRPSAPRLRRHEPLPVSAVS